MKALSRAVRLNADRFPEDLMFQFVLDRLAKVPGLKVVGRASSFQFKDKNADPASVGAALGVAYLLVGSVRENPCFYRGDWLVAAAGRIRASLRGCITRAAIRSKEPRASRRYGED